MSYITFKTIGEAGNLGSQLQQYASLYAIAKEANKQIVFPESSLQKGFGFKFAELVNLDIKIMPDSFFDNFIDIRPNDMLKVDPNVFNLDEHVNYNIVNRFDLFQYWYPKYSSDVESWGWNPSHLKEAEQIYSGLKIEGKESVAIHVRRGDYLLPQHNHFCMLDNDYYAQGLEQFFQNIDKYQFIVFSNDIDWCREHLIEESDVVTFFEPSSDYVDLVLMSLCDHQIIANSSYSWWAAYLNQNVNKKIMCPTNYLVGSSPWAHINANYYPPTWTNINNAN